MKHNRILSFALIGSILLLATACVEEVVSNESNEFKGARIEFSAATGYNNGVETRAEYSGQLYGGSNGYERIDWDGNDPIKIVYGNDEALFKVNTVSGTSDKNSYATVTKVSGSDFYWADNGPHVFYGLYPCGASANGTLTNRNHVHGIIPNAQPIVESHKITVDGLTKYQPDTDTYGYMAAYLSLASSQNTPVELPFRPAVTTFEFKLQRIQGDTELKIRSVTLSTEAVGSNPATPLAGTFDFDITGSYNNSGAAWGTVTTGSTSNSITVTFPVADFPDGASLPTNGYLDFSILALPIDLTGVKVTVTYTNNTSKTLPLKDGLGTATPTWHQFTGAKKYIITNTVPGTEVWHYEIDEIDDVTFTGHVGRNPIGYNVKSYKWSERTGRGTKVAVPWRTQYSLDGGQTWTDVPSSGLISGSDFSINSAAITGNGVNTSTYSTGEARSAALNGSSTPTGDIDHSPDAIIAELASRDPKGSVADPWDLSMHDIFGNTHAQTTANSYVITSPGTYKFPVVYGNGYTNGDTDYTEAFWPASDGTDGAHPKVSSIHSIFDNNKNINTFRYLPRFRTAYGYIAKADIVDDLATWNGALPGYFTLVSPDAAIVWQNCMERYSGESPQAIVQESSVSYNNHYITFTIRPEDIRPGNIIIAFRGGVGSGATQVLPTKTILWSWQIWVTANDLTPVQVEGGSLMPFNLGYIDSTPAGVEVYPDRIIKFRIVQQEDGIDHDTEDFMIEEIGDGRQWEASVGFNVYYQWGRKDPIIPAKDYGATTETPPSPATGTRQVYPDAAILKGSDYSSVSATGIDLAGGLVGYTAADYATGIKYPYAAFLNTGTTGWVGGSVNGYFDTNIPAGWNTAWADLAYRQESSVAVNLWNNGLYTTMDGNNAKWKTIYDPCPPGFCAPTIGVFSSFTNDTVVGRTSDGTYFSASNGGRVFLPYAGLRVFYNNGDGTSKLWAEEVRRSGYYWTDSTFGDIHNGNTESSYSKHFSFGNTSGTINAVTPIASHWVNGSLTDYTRGSSLAIRPMVDPKYAPSSSSPSSSAAAPSGSINSFNNGGELPN